MMYSNKLVACIKVNGKILRENKETVAVPFGSEYSILLKNLASVRALVRVSIDGTDATEGTWLIVPANGSVELERFIKNGNWDRGNRFKFIERTGKIEEHRGIKAEDGLVRIEYKFERVYEPVKVAPYVSPYTWYTITSNLIGQSTVTNTSGDLYNVFNDGHTNDCLEDSDDIQSFTKSSPKIGQHVNSSYPTKFSKSGTRSLNANAMGMLRSCAMFSQQSVEPQNENGITVAGSESDQKFVSGSWFPTEATVHTMVLKLVGAVNGTPIVEAVTVQHKPKCPTCGRVNKATNKFCAECGTSLVQY